MRDFLGEQEISYSQAEAIARAMYQVAGADENIHAHEREMIDSFYLECCKEAQVRPVDLAAHSWEATEALQVITTPELRDTLLRSCFLVAYADGQCSGVEEACINALGVEMGCEPSRVKDLHREVKLLLLGQFEDLKVFKDTAFTIGRQLGLTQEEVEEALSRA